MKVVLGEFIETGKKFSIDLSVLAESRAAILTNSGGGKSYLLRKFLEVTHSKIQQVVFDIEGELKSLRSKFDYILVGKGGDIPADIRSAELLAIKVLELESDVIIDLSEMKMTDRRNFVKAYLESMLESKQHLWHPVLVVIDEAHLFCPEKPGKNEWECREAVSDLMSRGRKRGFCGVLASQRVSKLAKDALAECNNMFIGRARLDIDMKRAGDELGLVGQDAKKLRTLKPGEFYTFGPALSDIVELVRVDKVITKHPEPGHRGRQHTPAPTAKVKSALAKLADLPKEAATEIKDMETLRSRVRELERETNKKVVPEFDKKKFDAEIERAKKSFEVQMKTTLKKAILDLKNGFNDKCSDVLGDLKLEISSPVIANHPAFKAPTRARVEQLKAEKPSPQKESGNIGRCERKILGFLLMKNGESFTKAQIGAMTGYAHRSGSFNTSLSNISKFIFRSGDRIGINGSLAPEVSELVNGEAPHRLEDWVSKLGACERKVYQTVMDSKDKTFPREEIAEVTGYKVSGSFNTCLSNLSTLGLIKRNKDGSIEFNRELNI